MEEHTLSIHTSVIRYPDHDWTVDEPLCSVRYFTLAPWTSTFLPA